jgi:hypothetical protein
MTGLSSASKHFLYHANSHSTTQYSTQMSDAGRQRIIAESFALTQLEVAKAHAKPTPLAPNRRF